jgi:hypothetical protein
MLLLQNCRTDLESEYQRHVATMHKGRLGYPNKVYLEHFGLTPQGKRWEV